MIVGIGIDIVGITRFAGMIERRPGMVERLFTDREAHLFDGQRRGPASLAARFAAKEAVAKVLGAPPGMAWHDCEILTNEAGRPRLEIVGTVATVAAALGIQIWHLSLTHDGDSAIAYAIGES